MTATTQIYRSFNKHKYTGVLIKVTTDSGQIDWNNWIIRLIAYVIDTVILLIVSWIIDFVVLAAIIVSGGFFFFFGGYFILLGILGLLSILYFIILDATWGATIGKRVLGLQVQTVEGGKVTIGKSFIRNISKIFALFLLLDWLIGIATVGNKQQKYTDRMAGTKVVQTKQAFQAIVPPPSPPPTSS
jgi:uncharacterized RDD family membrane protein YckC